MNGVTSASQQAGSSSGVGEHVALGNPNIYDPAPQTEQDLVSGTTTSTELRPDVADPPYGEPHQGATVISPTANGVLTTPTSAHARPDVLTTPGAPATVRVQEFFSAESTVSTHEDRNVRWMTRFTELMRAAATRGASSWDRVMDNLGMQPGPPATSNPGMSLFSGRTREVHMNFSPPEELPQSSTRNMQPPTSWTSASAQQPLFSQTQVAQLRQSQREHPLLYGQPSEVGSDHSSRLQAEVQRQMEEYTMKYQDELRALQSEVQKLRGEKRELELRASTAGFVGGNRVNANVPTDDLQQRAPVQLQPHSAPNQLQGNPCGSQGSLHLGAGEQNVRPGAPVDLRGRSNVPLESKNQLPEGYSVPRSAPDQLPGNPGGSQGSLFGQGDGPNVPRSAPDQLRGNPGGSQGSLFGQGDGPNVPRSAPDQLRGNSGGPSRESSFAYWCLRGCHSSGSRKWWKHW